MEVWPGRQWYPDQRRRSFTMATATSPLAQAHDVRQLRTRRSRKDVLGLSDTRATAHPTLLQAFPTLAQAGYNVSQTGPTPWIIRGTTPLRESHCHREGEMQQSAASRT